MKKGGNQPVWRSFKISLDGLYEGTRLVKDGSVERAFGRVESNSGIAVLDLLNPRSVKRRTLSVRVGAYGSTSAVHADVENDPSPVHTHS